LPPPFDPPLTLIRAAIEVKLLRECADRAERFVRQVRIALAFPSLRRRLG
jgi:hypothetical protein